MSWLEAIVLGIAQGLTEFLPVSSTAHLRIVPAFVGWEDPGAFFTAVVQLGTMLAVVLYFWRDLLRILRTWGASLAQLVRAGIAASRGNVERAVAELSSAEASCEAAGMAARSPGLGAALE